MTFEPDMPQQLDCTAVDEHLEAYVAGALEPGQEDRLSRHLTACPACAAQAALAERVAHELAELPAFDAPPELVARIKRMASEDRQETAQGRTPVAVLASRRRVWRPALLAASLAATLAVGWWLSARPGEPTVAEIAAAEQEARYALALVARIGRRAGAEVRQGVLIDRVATPLVESVGRSLDRGAAKKEVSS